MEMHRIFQWQEELAERTPGHIYRPYYGIESTPVAGTGKYLLYEYR